MEGWIKVYRSLLDWEWFHDSNMVHLWIYFLMKANRTDTNWQGVDIPRGSFVTTLNGICKDTGLSIQNVRTCIRKLVANRKLTHEVTNGLTNKVTNKFTIITICEYDSYNSQKSSANKETNRPSNTPSNNKLTNGKEEVSPIPPLEEYKQEEEKKKEILKKENSIAANAATSIQNRKDAFYNSLVPYVEKYGKEMIREFFDYWSEMNRSQTKMRFELEKVWELGKRLAKWGSKDNKTNNNKSGMNVGVILNERPKYTKGW